MPELQVGEEEEEKKREKIRREMRERRFGDVA